MKIVVVDATGMAVSGTGGAAAEGEADQGRRAHAGGMLSALR